MQADPVSIDLGNNSNWDFGPPAAVTNLTAVSSAWGAAIDLNWQTPGDDGSNGTLYNSTFTIQYTSNTSFAQSSSWDPEAGQPSDVYRVTIATTNLSPSDWVSKTIDSLSGGDTYYFRLWTTDDAGNYSAISSGATNYATPIDLQLLLSTDTLSFGKLNPNAIVVISTPIMVTNQSNVEATYVFRATATAEEWPWQIGSLQGVDQFVLWMVTSESEPSSIDFSNEDKLTESDLPCTSSSFSAASITCTNVPPGEQRAIWFQIAMPLVVHTDKEQIIRVVGTATRSN
jgi:hypothetical protein